MEVLNKVVDFLANHQFGVWGWPTIILILATGIFMTVKLRALQVAKFNHMLKVTIIPTVKSIGKKREADSVNSISQFEAFAAAISGTIGTGNIIGVTSAILTGGPGAVFWMWVSAFFGMVTNYSENVLGLYYRKKDENGDFSGGAMYYITHGLGLKWLGYIASAFCAVAAISMSSVQTNKITSTITSAVGNEDTWLKLLIGGIIAVVIAAIIIGGIKRIGKVASVLVPFMTILFFAMAILIIIINITALPGAFVLIFKHAFNFSSAAGGIFGYATADIIRKGMARGVFSNEAGLGSSVIAHSASETREPVKQGLWGVFEVFLDTFVICTLVAFVILTSYDTAALTGKESDTAMAIGAFSNNFGVFGTVAFSVILPIFAFTTILAWSYYGEKAVEFLADKLGKKGQKICVLAFKIIYVALIVVASVLTSELVWSISDISNALMAIPNLIAVVALSGVVAKITKNYFERKSGKDVEPMLSAYPEINEEFKKDLKKKQL
ncbi:MAG: sodium:alanine symporter family protein [Clostridia bacterium]|nr:sodium:alanine symporter family protein [Clostridia bacterium]